MQPIVESSFYPHGKPHREKGMEWRRECSSFPERRYYSSGLVAVAALAMTVPAAAKAVPASATTRAAATAIGPNWSSSVPAALPSCPSATLCTFQNAGYGGTRWNFSYNSRPHATWFWIGSGANDKISSFYNHRAWTSYFAKNCPADAQWASTPGGGFVSNLNDGHHDWPNGTSANDSISAIALGTNTGVHYPAHGSC